MNVRNKPILCVDFDGVIHLYTTPWERADIISDGPVPGALRWLWKATEWFDVHIYSIRSKSSAGIKAMHEWMVKHSAEEWDDLHPMCTTLLEAYPITFSHEKPAAFLTIDDRALCFGDRAGRFKPWNKRG